MAAVPTGVTVTGAVVAANGDLIAIGSRSVDRDGVAPETGAASVLALRLHAGRWQQSTLSAGISHGDTPVGIWSIDGKLIATTQNPHGFAGHVFTSVDGVTWRSNGAELSKHRRRYADTLVMSAPDSRTEGIDRSRDGGITWDTVNSPCTDCIVTDVQPLAADTAIATTNDEQDHGHVYRTRDAGTTWTALASLPCQTLFDALTKDPRGGLAMDCGFDGAIARSADGGATWSIVATPFKPGDDAKHATDLASGDKDELWLDVEGTLQHSIDGGAHWSVESPPGVTAARHLAQIGNAAYVVAATTRGQDIWVRR